MLDAASALARLCDSAAAVSAHYVVDVDGTVFRLVPEEDVAWHAGVSSWRGRRGLNRWSIGIEVVNPGHEHGYQPFPEAQLEACLELGFDIVERWRIEPWNVVGHGDIAPMRRADPGELFPWQRFAEAGIGLWPEPRSADPVPNVVQALEAIGYAIASAPQPTTVSGVLLAFQRRFAPDAVSGRACAVTSGRLHDVALALDVDLVRSRADA